MCRWNTFLFIGILAVSVSCTPQIEITPTFRPVPTATAVLSREEVARQLTQRVTDNLRHLSQLNALCDKVGGIHAYHEAIRDTFTELLSQPESRQFDLNNLETIFTQGIVQSNDFLPVTAQFNYLAAAPKLTGRTVDGREVILATWGNAPCEPSGHVHYTTDLYVFDTTGLVLFESGAEEVTVYPAVNGWLVVGGAYNNDNLWHIHPVNNHWEAEVLFQGTITGLSIEEDARPIQIQYASVSYTPPCHFQPEKAAAFEHALLSGGERVWVWHDNAYVLESDRFQKAEVYLRPDGEMLQVLDDWQKYCMD